MFSRICACVRYSCFWEYENGAYGETEVRVVLEEDGYYGTEVSEFESLDVAVVDEDSALCWVVDTGDEFQYRTLSRAVPPDDDLQLG